MELSQIREEVVRRRKAILLMPLFEPSTLNETNLGDSAPSYTEELSTRDCSLNYEAPAISSFSDDEKEEKTEEKEVKEGNNDEKEDTQEKEHKSEDPKGDQEDNEDSEDREDNECNEDQEDAIGINKTTNEDGEKIKKSVGFEIEEMEEEESEKKEEVSFDFDESDGEREYDIPLEYSLNGFNGKGEEGEKEEKGEEEESTSAYSNPYSNPFASSAYSNPESASSAYSNPGTDSYMDELEIGDFADSIDPKNATVSDLPSSKTEEELREEGDRSRRLGDYNNRFQDIMLQIKSGKNEEEAYTSLIGLSQDFLYTVKAYGKIIISEVNFLFLFSSSSSFFFFFFLFSSSSIQLLSTSFFHYILNLLLLSSTLFFVFRLLTQYLVLPKE